MITAAELAKLTGLNVRSIYRMAREGRIPHYRVGNRIYFEMGELQDGTHEIVRPTVGSEVLHQEGKEGQVEHSRL